MAQGFSAACSICISSKRVNAECLIVCVFRTVRARAVSVHHPEKSAVLAVKAIFCQKLVGVVGKLFVLLAADCVVNCRIKPQNAAMENYAFLGVFVHFQVVPYKAVKTAALIIGKLIPVWQNYVL